MEVATFVVLVVGVGGEGVVGAQRRITIVKSLIDSLVA